MTDGSLVIDTALDTKGVDLGVSKLKSSLGKLTKLLAVSFSVKSLISFGKQAVSIASDIQEVDNVVEKAFGNMRAEVDDFASTAIESLGMSRLTAYQTSSTFMSMGKSMLDSAENAKNMALELTKLTGNMSSFFNVSQDLASIALKSIYTGETETLKQYGVVMTEVNLKQFAMEQGITKAYSAMTQSEKVMLRYKYVMQQLNFIGDDFIDTQGSWANQTRILKEQWKEFMSIIGSALVTVLTPAIKVINSMVAALINVANGISAVLSKLGIKTQPIKQASAAYEDLTDSVNDYGTAVSNAGKKASKSMNNFDELNNLSSQSTSGSSGAAGGGSISDQLDIKDFNSNLDDVEKKTNDWTDTFIEKLKNVKEYLSNIFEENFKIGFFDGIGDKFQETVNSIKEKINDIKEKIRSIFSSEDVSKSFAGFKNSFIGFFQNLGSSVIEIVKTLVKSVGKVLGSIVDYVATIFNSIVEAVSKQLDKDAPELKAIVSDLFDNLKTFFDDVSGLIDALLPIVKGFIEDVADVISFLLKNVLAPITSWLISILVPAVSEVIKLVLKGVSEAITILTELIGGIIDVLKGLIKFVKGEFSGDWKLAWNGIKDVVSGVKRALSGIINGIIKMFEVMVNTVIKGVNKMIESLNKFSLTIPDWIPELGGKSVGFNLKTLTPVSLPRLASGAVIPANKPFAAILGDQTSGTNIETPLNTMIEAFNAAFDNKQGETNQILQQILQALIEKETGIRKSELFESVRKSAREYQNSTGRLAF